MRFPEGVPALQQVTSVKPVYGAGIGPTSLCTVTCMQEKPTPNDPLFRVQVTDDQNLLVALTDNDGGYEVELSIRDGLLLAALLGRAVEKVLAVKKASASNTEAPSPLRNDA